MLAFLMSPLAKWGAVVLVILALLAGMVFEVQSAIHKHDDAVRAQITDKVKADAVAEAAKNAAEDQKFDSTVVAQQAQDTKNLNTMKADTAAKVQNVQKDISSRVASGSLQDRPASPLILSTIYEIDALQTARMENMTK